MTSEDPDVESMHWMMYILQTMDVGLVVVDREYKVQMWNSFMVNHSGLYAADVHDRELFDIYPDINREWFQHKLDTVFLLDSRAFTMWEERPYVFKFKNYRPITGTAEFMYQYTSLIPIKAATGYTSHVAIIVYDVTDMAVSRQALEKANQSLHEVSITDRMTGLYRRGHWESCLQNEFNRHRRTNGPISLVMFDIDHFKAVNDTYGHHPGDEVIKETASILLSNKRSVDIAGRYGGEEFGVVLIGSSAESGLIFAERLRKAVEQHCISVDGHDIRVTVSLGLSDLTSDMRDYKQWIKQADAALYHSKRNGRNQSTIYQDSMAQEIA